MTAKATEQQEDPLYLQMLKQMGIKPEYVPEDMRQTIYEKLKLKPTAQEKRKVAAKQQDLAHKSESELIGALGGEENLTMGALFSSLSDKTTNTTKLRSQLNKMTKDKSGSIKLDAPVAARIRKQQEQAANYKINQQKMGKYINQVKKGREEVQADFTAHDKILHGGGVNLSSTKQIAANQTPVTELEK